MSSTAKAATGAETEEDNSSSVVKDSVVSSKPEEDDQPCRAKKKGSGDTSSSTTNDPSLTSATAKVETVVASHPTSQSSGLPSFAAAAAAAAAPPVPLRVKKPRRAGFRTKFLQQVRSKEYHNTLLCLHPTLTNFVYCSFRLNANLRADSSESCWIEKARMIVPSCNGQLTETASSSLINPSLRR
jgi:hypothetical protein